MGTLYRWQDTVVHDERGPHPVRIHDAVGLVAVIAGLKEGQTMATLRVRRTHPGRPADGHGHRTPAMTARCDEMEVGQADRQRLLGGVEVDDCTVNLAGRSTSLLTAGVQVRPRRASPLWDGSHTCGRPRPARRGR